MHERGRVREVSKSGEAHQDGGGTDPRDAALGRPARDGSGEMFDAIAERYDLLNRLISLGVDQSWRRQTVAALELPPDASANVLDLATGTADLALLLASKLPQAHVTGLDPSAGMLAVGQRKVDAAGLASRVDLVVGDAQQMPFEDDHFDGVTMAFGIRNVPDRPRALREMARVTKPGARVAILELGEPHSGPLAALGRFHMHRVVPFLGSLLSSSHEYKYLPNSIAKFPAPEAFASTMRAAGFSNVEARVQRMGVCHVYVGTAPALAASA